jgi:hypothetical protein
MQQTTELNTLTSITIKLQCKDDILSCKNKVNTLTQKVSEKLKYVDTAIHD